jgi:hypothetical protein
MQEYEYYNDGKCSTELPNDERIALKQVQYKLSKDDEQN